jgi:hypothetical protein
MWQRLTRKARHVPNIASLAIFSFRFLFKTVTPTYKSRDSPRFFSYIGFDAQIRQKFT